MIIKLLLEQYLKEEDNNNVDNIPAIEIPYADGDKKKGYLDALNKLANVLFNKNGMKKSDDKSSPADPRLKPLPMNSDDNDNNNDESDDNNESDNNSENNPNNNNDNDKSSDENEKKNNNNKSDKNDNKGDGTLSKEEIDKLIDKIKETRNKLDDVIDDNDNKIDHNSEVSDNAEEAKDELDKLEDDAKEADNINAVNKIQNRLQKIADFWNNEDNVKQMQSDSKARLKYREVQKQLTQAKKNAQNKNSQYRPATISEIVNNINRTIKNQTQQYRDSDWSHYNNRSDELGYLAPGRFNAEKYNKPKVVFYFDVSGSGWYNKEKIAMGHRIEEALKKLDREGRIDLRCLYFGSRVHDKFTVSDPSNSDAPIPHAIGLLNHDELDNVIIMTDSDPYSSDYLKVPGYAWLLFYDYANSAFATHVSGQKGTTIFMIQH